jgi:hypothetical protein
MPILASLNAKNRSKSPFSIGELFSIISEFTVAALSSVLWSIPEWTAGARLRGGGSEGRR